jgi:hypothetical protein
LHSHFFSVSRIRYGKGAFIFSGVYDHLGRSALSVSYCTSARGPNEENGLIALVGGYVELAHSHVGLALRMILCNERDVVFEAIIFFPSLELGVRLRKIELVID